MNLWRGYTRLPDGTLRRNVEVHEGANGASGPSRPSGSLVQGMPDWKARRTPVNPPLTANQTRADDRPVKMGRPRKSPSVPMNGRGRVYATEEERIAARRRAWRESARRRRENAA